MEPLTLIDGPLGTELLARGVDTPLPGWSAHALEAAPDAVRAIHADYARAGATVHTTDTFRTRARVFPDRWRAMVRAACALCRAGAEEGAAGPVRVAGSLAPLEDCYRPDLSPADPRPEHRALARALDEEGCDLLLCETFPHAGEALVAVEEAVRTGRETWVALTAGPDANLMTPAEMGAAARACVDAGAAAVLVNCVPARETLRYVRALAGLGVPFGAYANAGAPDERVGWSSAPGAPARYADFAETWVEAGATLVGACCGTGPAHVAELARRFAPS